MNYLAIDTSGKSMTLALNYNGKVYSYFDADCGVKHCEQIMVKLEELLKEADCDKKDLNFIAVVVGAGSFTGIRIGVSTAKALCFALKIPCLSITSFDTVAYNKKDGFNLAVINAGHGGFYVCGYNGNKVVLDAQYILKENLLKLKNKYRFLSFENIEGIDCEVVDIVKGLILAVEDKAGQATYNLDDIAPLYVRLSQAEEGRL